MRTIAVTGSASGIGAATRKHLEAGGARVIGVDLAGEDIDADLAGDAGRADAIAGIESACGGKLDGVLLAAGLGPDKPHDLVIAVNFFGVVTLLDGLLPVLRAGTDPAVCVIASHAGTITPMPDTSAADMMLAGDEAAAKRAVADLPGAYVYGLSKLAVARAVRVRAVPFGEAGVRLNALAPGPVSTPLLQGIYDEPGLGDAARALPIPYGGVESEPEQIADVIDWLLSPASEVIHGAVIYADRGTDSLVRPHEF